MQAVDTRPIFSGRGDEASQARVQYKVRSSMCIVYDICSYSLHVIYNFQLGEFGARTLETAVAIPTTQSHTHSKQSDTRRDRGLNNHIDVLGLS